MKVLLKGKTQSKEIMIQWENIVRLQFIHAREITRLNIFPCEGKD